VKYFVKEARRKRVNPKSQIAKGLAFGAMSGLASTLATHPIEHQLYGKGKGFFKHLGARMAKGLLASAVGFGTYYYLSHNEDKIKRYLRNVKRSYHRKYFK